MPIFRALTSHGLVDPLEQELIELGMRPHKKGLNWVEFETNWKGCYAVNHGSRIATRVILPILDFKAFTEDELYHKTLNHDFTQYIDPEQTLAVTSTLTRSNIRDQRILGLKVKDAVVDQFRDKYRSRPSIDREQPDLRLFVRCVHDTVSMAVDTSGRNLSDRGYRLEAGLAPLKENMAAGLLRLTGWTPDQVLVDPMCGSGTFLIEAALKARNQWGPASDRPFAFQKFKKFRDLRYDQDNSNEKSSAPSDSIQKSDVELKLFGSDFDIGMVLRAQRNAERAEVQDVAHFERLDFHKLEPPAPTGVMIVNPPYGERLMRDENLEALYSDFASHLKKNFKGWTMWMLSGNLELTKCLRLKAEKKIMVTNGDIECRFLCYPIT